MNMYVTNNEVLENYGRLTPSLPRTYVSRHVFVHPVCLGRDIYVMNAVLICSKPSRDTREVITGREPPVKALPVTSL